MLGVLWVAAFGATAFAHGGEEQPPSAEMLIEGPAAAHRSVMIPRGDLADPIVKAKNEHKLRSAAKAVCAEQYPTEGEYLFTRACVLQSLEDALAAMRALQTRTAREATEMIAVNARAR